MSTEPEPNEDAAVRETFDAAFRERFADALRLLRTRQQLSQTAVSQIDGAPDFRTLSHWETRRKVPGLRLLTGYLAALDLDFHDLQDALDQVSDVGTTAGRIDELAGQVDRLARVCEDLGERRLVVVERRVSRVGDLAAALERLAERIAALESHVAPSWTELGDTPAVSLK